MKAVENIELATELRTTELSVQPVRRTQPKTPSANLENNLRKTIYLHPGQLYASVESCVVTTILGSCVAVCLCDPRTGIGGINHFLLPVGGNDQANSHRYGDVAVTALVKQVIALGADARRLQAKLFGGANVLEAFRDRVNHLGTQNIGIARELLAAAGIAVIGADVGGQRGRKLIFQTSDGAAWVKEL